MTLNRVCILFDVCMFPKHFIGRRKNWEITETAVTLSSVSANHSSSRRNLYSVMQPYGNSFGGEIVLDSFNIVYRDEGSILDQKYEKKMCLDHNHEDT